MLEAKVQVYKKALDGSRAQLREAEKKEQNQVEISTPSEAEDKTPQYNSSEAETASTLPEVGLGFFTMLALILLLFRG
jgi:hypothetical protein